MLKDWSLQIPKQVSITFSLSSFRSELFHREHGVFPFYTLMDWFVTNCNGIQKDLTFLMILLQKAVTNVQTVMPMLFHKLLWN
jgi:hypothetical protein